MCVVPAPARRDLVGLVTIAPAQRGLLLVTVAGLVEDLVVVLEVVVVVEAVAVALV